MKAKEYAQRVIDAENKEDEICEVFKNIFAEGLEIAKSRNAKSASSLVAIFKELNQKYTAYAKIVNTHFGLEFLHTDGFEKFLKEKSPEFHKLLFR